MFYLRSDGRLEAALAKACAQGLIVQRTENNPHLKVSYKGAGGCISEKWNVKIYQSGAIVCVDNRVLEEIRDGTVGKVDPKKIVLQIDDAGWGFCLLGCMIGVSDGKRIETDVVDVSFFQDLAFRRRAYLYEYTRKGWDIINRRFGATPYLHRIEICSGYINSHLREFLRERGFTVTITCIGEPLQSHLERLFREYVCRTLGKDLAYDPKEIGDKRVLALKHREALRWGKRNAPHLLKTGWLVCNAKNAL